MPESLMLFFCCTAATMATGAGASLSVHAPLRHRFTRHPLLQLSEFELDEIETARYQVPALASRHPA